MSVSVIPSENATDIKVSCRKIWKVYGENPAQFFKAGEGDVENPGALRERIQSSGHAVAAYDVSFDVRLGETFVIMGLSGSGKSTVVRCLSRLVRPEAGRILLDQKDLLEMSKGELIAIRRHKMGMVFQNFGLLPHLTVLENVGFPLKVQEVPPADRRNRALKVIQLVGLEGRESSYPRELSGGQQQRVGFARSLVTEPEIWFLDEPFSALDPLIRRQLQDEFIQLQRMLQKTIVFITHDFLEALRLADRIAMMKDGSIVQMGAPADVVLRPVNDYVAEFTRDVPRIKVLAAKDIMEPAADGFESPISVLLSTGIEQTVQRLAENKQDIAVVDQEGEVRGRVTPLSIVNALANLVQEDA